MFFSVSKQRFVSRSRAVHPNKNFIQKALLLELEAIYFEKQNRFFLFHGEMYKLKNVLKKQMKKFKCNHSFELNYPWYFYTTLKTGGFFSCNATFR